MPRKTLPLLPVMGVVAGLLLEDVEDVDRVLELDRVRPAIGIAIMILDQLPHARHALANCAGRCGRVTALHIEQGPAEDVWAFSSRGDIV